MLFSQTLAIFDGDQVEIRNIRSGSCKIEESDAIKILPYMMYPEANIFLSSSKLDLTTRFNERLIKAATLQKQFR